MGRMQRVKGAAFERLVVNLFKPVFEHARRGIGQMRSASEVPDVEIHPDWWPECKHGQNTSWRAAMKQALLASKGTGRQCFAITRDNRGPIMVHLPIEFFIELLLKIPPEQR